MPDPEADTLAFGYVFAIGWQLAAIIISVANIIHTKKVISDFCTTRRKSVAHRRILPKIDANYKIVALLTLIFTNVLMAGSILVVYSSIILNNTSCAITLYFRCYTFQIAKTCMYLIFVTRLRIAFHNTIHAYSNTCLAFTISIIISLALLSFIAVSFGLAFSLQYFSDGEGFPDLCHANFNMPFELVFTSSLVTQDLLLGSGLAIAFIVPLRKAMGTKQANQLAHAQTIDSFDLNIQLTLKVTILTGVAVISTVVSLLLYALDVPFGRCLISADACINVLCILLMTPYYRDEHFNSLCCLCICCYERRKHKSSGLSLFPTASSSGSPAQGTPRSIRSATSQSQS